MKNCITYGPTFPSKLDLMGIRFMTDPNPAPEGDPKPAPDANAPWTKENFDPDRAWKLVENLRNDLAATKTSTATEITAAADKARKDALADLAKALGGGETEETDPAKLAAKITDLSTQVQAKDGDLTKAQADIKARDLALSVATVGAGQANLKLLLANEEFKTSIASVEPTDEAAIQAKITAALQANPALKATPPSSGSDGHQGGQLQTLETLLATAIKDGDTATSIVLKRRIAEAKAKS